jgi:hypothetical protein
VNSAGSGKIYKLFDSGFAASGLIRSIADAILGRFARFGFNLHGLDSSSTPMPRQNAGAMPRAGLPPAAPRLNHQSTKIVL